MAPISSSSDLWVEILKRLQKSICRFRCVCKPWNSLLSSNFFIALHHKFTLSNTPADQKSFFLMPETFQLQQFIVYRPQEQQRGGGVRERVTFLNLPYATNPAASDFKCVCLRIRGVVHGVVCLSSGLNIVLWNPTIHKHICLWRDSQRGSVGIGFDAVKNDLKVVVVPHVGPYYHVFSVEDDCWRTKSLADSYMCRPKGPGCFVNGTIYWILTEAFTCGQRKETSTLLLFDCESEEFKTTALPPELGNDYCWPSRWSLFKHGGKLSLLRIPKQLTLKWVELWVMEDKYCCTWRKVLTIPDRRRSMLGNTENILNPKNRIKLSSSDLPVRLTMFDHQPVTSEHFEETLYLMNMKSYPSPKQELTCDSCSYLYKYIGSGKTLFQSRLL